MLHVGLAGRRRDGAKLTFETLSATTSSSTTFPSWDRTASLSTWRLNVDLLIPMIRAASLIEISNKGVASGVLHQIRSPQLAKNGTEPPVWLFRWGEPTLTKAWKKPVADLQS
ncbi:hypothetical protein [Bradyrhizobium sp. USDA 329]|uniref:hypothetical protein n=1 Tax=unclassified Bradyrhizobium TaxID=2631580 RepID=UPI003513F1F7